MPEVLCPCGSQQAYASCCGPLHAGAPAPSPERLMRSRYSAFVQGNVPYLLASWHASTRPDDLTLEPATKWLGLTIKAARATGADAAVVEFVARSRLGGGPAQRLHEVSRFVREAGRWFYVDGELH
jgi:SEC-C motif domain protein